MLEGNFYRHIIKNSPMGYFYGELIWDKSKELWDFIILDINARFESISGLEEGKILGKSIVNVLPVFNNHNFNWIDFFKKLKDTSSASSAEAFIESLNGYFKVYGYHYENNQYILQLVEVEKKLHKEYTLIKELIGNLPFSAWVKDTQGRYIVINKNYEVESGFSKEYIIGKTDYEIYPESLAEQFKKQDNEIINDNHKVFTYEEYFNNEWHLLHKFAVYNGNSLLGTVGFSLNINEEKKAKSEIEQKNKFLKILINSIPDFIFYKDLKGTYLGFNESLATQYFGKHEAELVGKAYSELRSNSEHNEIFIKQDEEVIRDRDAKVYEESLVLIDGSTKEYETIKTPFYDENNNIMGILGISRDITHRKEAEKALERLRTEFFANLSHEFRTPLNLIFSSLQMAEFKLKQSALNHELGLSKYTNIIRQNSFRLLRLVNNLIDSTKIDAGYVEYTPENYDIVSFVKGIAHSVWDFANNKDIDIIFNSQIEKKIMAFDLDKMERIILNLISNGIKFNKPQGKIEICISSKNKFIEIHVKDSGIGIPEDKLSFVFERFKQVNNRLTKVSEGSGIGLSLVKSLVEIHRGTIEVISTLGEGSEFIVKLPDIKIHEKDEIAVTKSQILCNSSVERIQIEFSDIYGQG